MPGENRLVRRDAAGPCLHCRTVASCRRAGNRRERYDELSEKLGCDLAYAYVDYRMEQLMIDRLVRERMPKHAI